MKRLRVCDFAAADGRDVAAARVVPAARLDLATDGGALGLEARQRHAPQHAALLQLYQAIERGPAEQPRVGVRGLPRARLPDAVIGLAPVTAHIFAAAAEHALGLAIEARAGAR